MQGREIERRFIVEKLSPQFWFYCCLPGVAIRQGYFEVPVVGTSFRVRIKDDKFGFITKKGGKGIERGEKEWPVPIDCAKEIINLAHYHIEKTRYEVGRWEVDFFQSPLDGLIIAEIELDDTDEQIVIPEWLGKVREVTDSITNHHLARLVSELKINDTLAFHPVYLENMSNFSTIALTGGPGSGKSSVMELLKKEYSQLKFIPEMASLVMSHLNILPHGGFNRYFQRLVYNTGNLFESASIQHAIAEGKRGSVSDRGLLDGAVYFEGGIDEYEEVLRTNIKDEYARYKLVICLDVPPEDIYEKIRANNPNRSEKYALARERGGKTKMVWQNHPNFVFVGNEGGWDEKVRKVKEAIDTILK